ncbi:MAG: hypothetical protein AAGF59_08545, partial [Pseudomonadota bacterium]
MADNQKPTRPERSKSRPVSQSNETTAPTEPHAKSTGFAMSPADIGLYAVTVFVWGTSWYAIKGQLGLVAPEVSLVWRFSLASLALGLWMLVTGARFRFAPALHVRFAALG